MKNVKALNWKKVAEHFAGLVAGCCIATLLIGVLKSPGAFKPDVFEMVCRAVFISSVVTGTVVTMRREEFLK